ncbi:MAG: hypothetical protein ABDI19_08920 [Armatimonadota bacterium]
MAQWGENPSHVDVKSILISNGATFTVSGRSITLRDPANNNAAGTLLNQGRLRFQGGSFTGVLINEAQMDVEGTIFLGSATIFNSSSGIIEYRRDGFSVQRVPSLVDNAGVLRKTTNQNAYVNVPLQNTGLIDVQAGELSIQSSFVQTGGETRVRAGSTLEVIGSPIQLQGGKLTGSGLVEAGFNTWFVVNNSAGIIAPGINDPNEPTANPIGILTIDGDLTLGANAVLEIELAGTDNSNPSNPQYDQIRIARPNYSRSVQLNGTLRLKGRHNFVPSVGQVFDIILRTASSWNRTGTFSRVEVDPDTLPCVEVAVRYLTDRVRVEVVRASGSPDTNRDGCVDDADLLAVLFAFGQTGSTPADVNCDGIVDDADLLAVLFAFGQGC